MELAQDDATQPVLPVLRTLILHLDVPKLAEHANAHRELAIGSQLSERAWARLKP